MALQRQYEEKEFYTEDDYFVFEQTAFGRWEYVCGEIRAMAGGTDDHNTVVTNIGRALGNAMVPRGCRVYVSDMKLHTGDEINTFPDVTVVRGPRRYHRGRTDVVTNPLLIVEVLSPSTEGYDRGEKFDHYRTIPTLADYLLVDPNPPRVLHYSLNGDQWTFRETTGIKGKVYSPSVKVELALTDVCALIEFA